MKKIFSISRAGLRHLAALAAFCALALGMIAYTDRVLWDKNGTIMGFYEEPKNSVDYFMLAALYIYVYCS